jgi:hypothetical protein
MAERKDVTESISLIREAENLVKESSSLLSEIKKCADDKNGKAETEALKEIVNNLKSRNDSLYMENVLLKSKVRELSQMIELKIEKENSIKDYFKNDGN